MAQMAQEQPIPRGILLGAASLVVLTILAAFLARVGDVGSVRTTLAPATETVELRFADMPDGSVQVINAADASKTRVLHPGTNGFVRVVLRGLARDRRAYNVGSEPPFRLSRLTDGRVVLQDQSTGRMVALGAFGATNEAAFTQLFDLGRKER